MKDLKIPKVIFKTREGDFSDDPDACAIGGKWINKSTNDFFLKKRVVLFSLPGAFTPTCSSQQLPGFEKNFEKIKSLGIDEIYCCSVNDAYVMNAWAEKIKIKNIKLIPDRSGLFTKYMGMFNDGIVEKWWQEPGINNDGSDDDPYIETTPENCIKYLQKKN